MVSQPIHLEVSAIQLSMLSMFKNVSVALWGNFWLEVIYATCLITAKHLAVSLNFPVLKGRYDNDTLKQQIARQSILIPNTREKENSTV